VLLSSLSLCFSLARDLSALTRADANETRAHANGYILESQGEANPPANPPAYPGTPKGPSVAAPSGSGVFVCLSPLESLPKESEFVGLEKPVLIFVCLVQRQCSSMSYSPTIVS
jgi:hypothetical protein